MSAKPEVEMELLSPLLLWRITLIWNISKPLTDSSMGSKEVEYETTPRLSIGTMIFDLGWPWSALDLGYKISASHISNTLRHTISDNRRQIRNHQLASDWHHDLWSWMTLKNLGSRSLKLHVKYFKNRYRFDVLVNWSRIKSHPCAVDWHYYLGPWLSLNRPRSRSQNFHFKYLECQWRYSVGHSEGHIGNHQWAFD